ncbi:sodium-coupled monocarboxylate transporter 1 [Folsomia candida]|uniref:sodium-coupled monocarboxylate transporter 1 n=1 Tax=Folsomia candida TaxID=158441 RepID=UPI000B903163|nr:sodium-coupled monocarboxylate transporter 1 [Folsomia candida]XP_021951663.1 sodium-coupled monocarboxylate transporter 1 [Folsomia candida]XP_021951664.1 sodium-coupled monocarboxylate transporter 1 [Folsomia candida]XP_035706618.1 sodium-coupled monocarboxylate transporter 1 [Folsomia candida]
MSFATFTIMDYVVLLSTLIISMAIGVYYAVFKKQETNADLLVGGRSMPLIPTALSLLATYMSPILVLGYAGEIYSYGTLMYETVFSSLVIVPIAAWIFMPTLYNLKLTSAYEYLEYRFDSPAVRIFAAGTFITQITLYMGVVLFAPALALNAVVDFPIWIAVVAMGLSCALYTSIGGLRAVVWTDVFQMVIMLAGMFAIVIVGIMQVGGLSKVFQIAGDHGRIQFLKFHLDPFERLNSVNIFIGHAIMVLSICGCQQTAVQRYCSMKTLKKGIMTLFITLPLVVFTVSLAAIAGVVIFANYATCDPISLGLIKRNDQIAPHFVLEYLSPTSGLLGLFIACLFSASLSTVSSGINSVTAVTFEDFLAKLKYFSNMGDIQQGRVSKFLALIFGVLAIAMAFLAANFDGVLAASIVLNGSVAGPLLAVFLMGIMLPFTNKYGAIVGMIVGHTVTIWICLGAFFLKHRTPTLPFSTDGCSAEIWDKVNQTAVTMLNSSETHAAQFVESDVPWPEKIYTVSFLLYPLIGCTVTIVVGSIVSILTGYQRFSKDQDKYIHPLLVSIIRRFRTEKEYDFKHNSNGIDLKSMVTTTKQPITEGHFRSNGSYHKSKTDAKEDSSSNGYATNGHYISKEKNGGLVNDGFRYD